MDWKIDGYKVELGDKMYDTVEGWGEVVGLGPKLEIKFTKRSTAFDENGIRAGRDMRTLYWQNPTAVVPPKDPAKWNLITRICKGVRDEVLSG